MIQSLLFLAFSGLVSLALILAGHTKKAGFKSIISLFLFGIIISVPFLMIEYMSGSMKYYFVILAFILIELGILYAEKNVQYFHELIHHNVKEFRFLSFLLIGIGFTYSEISFAIFHMHGPLSEFMDILPLKTAYSLLVHTVLTSAASLIRVGNLFAETIYETILKLISYYSRITVISLSHYLYVFSIQHNYILLIIALLITSIFAFFILKKHLDTKSPASV